MSKFTPKEIAIQDNFDDRYGKFRNWTAGYSLIQDAAVKAQRHVDVRAFYRDDIETRITMLHLDLLQINYLNSQQMGSLEDTVAVGHGENWTAGVVGRKTDLNNWRAINLDCTTGTNVTSSFIRKVTGSNTS